MRKRTLTALATLATVLMTTGISAGASAQAVSSDANGCAALAGLVYARITPAGMSGAGAMPHHSAEGRVRLCDQTARAVSSGFSKAMADMNIYVSWPTPEQQRGDVCYSVYLSQCYPSQYPHMPPMALSSAMFVMNSWKSVQAAVYATMPDGPASDVSRFSEANFDLQLRQRLSTPEARYR